MLTNTTKSPHLTDTGKCNTAAPIGFCFTILVKSRDDVKAWEKHGMNIGKWGQGVVVWVGNSDMLDPGVRPRGW